MLFMLNSALFLCSLRIFVNDELHCKIILFYVKKKHRKIDKKRTLFLIEKKQEKFTINNFT